MKGGSWGDRLSQLFSPDLSGRRASQRSRALSVQPLCVCWLQKTMPHQRTTGPSAARTHFIHGAPDWKKNKNGAWAGGLHTEVVVRQTEKAEPHGTSWPEDSGLSLTVRD